jgi:hypothetical protein
MSDNRERSAQMVWHIFKKDWKLLWHVALLVTGLLWTMATLIVLAWRWRNPQLASVLQVLEPLAYLSIAFLVTLIIQQDPIPGVGQDWLVRPIKRRDLLLAKLLFVMLTAQVPILAGDVFQGMANGFAFPQSMAAALARNICVSLLLIWPLVALASFTRSLAETTVGIVIVMMVGGGLQLLVSGLLRNGPGPGRMIDPTAFTGVEWVGQWLRLALFLLAATLVLGLQYFRRKTIPTRWVAGFMLVILFLTELLPWRIAFAAQKRLSPIPGAAQAVSVVFDPGLGRAQRPQGLDSNDFVDRIRALQGNAIVLLPVHVTGLPDDSVLSADRTEIRLTTADGRVLNLDSRNDFRLLQEGHGDGEGRVHPEIRMKQGQYDQLKDQSVRLEIEYSLTLFRLLGAHALTAMGGDQQIPGIGRCTTTIDDEKDDVILRCTAPGKHTNCVTAFLENASSGRRNPRDVFCPVNYAPYPLSIDPDVMGGMGLGLPFRDLNGLAHYPVDGNQLPQSQVVLRNYQPVEHFTRRLVIAQIKLSEWEPQ